MAFWERIKKGFIRDSIIFVVLVGAVFLYLYLSGKMALGWEIKKKEKVLDNEEKEVTESVLVYKGGTLTLKDSTLLFDSSYDNEFGLYVAGDGKLELDDSLIDGEDYKYFFSAEEYDGKSPTVKVKDSDIAGHSGIYVSGRTKFEAQSSNLYDLFISDRARVELKESKVFPTFSSEKNEKYEDLVKGEGVSYELKSKQGWRLEMENCNVLGYGIEVYEDDDIKVLNSEGVVLALHIPSTSPDTDDDEEAEDKDLEERDISVDTGTSSSGSLDDLGFELSWENTIVDKLDLHLNNESRVKTENSRIRNFSLDDNSYLKLRSLELDCFLCGALGNSELLLDSIVVPESGGESPILVISSGSKVRIENSDVKELRIFLLDGASVTILNSEYDEDKVIEFGEGSVITEE